MNLFLQFLTEKAFIFANGKDQDYTSGSNTVLLFNKDDAKQYVIAGKTHGIQSHAIKHLDEFNSAFVKEMIDTARQIIKTRVSSNKLPFCGIYKRYTGFQETDPFKAITQATDIALKNTLDTINDKVKTRTQLLPIETELYNNVIKKIESEYSKEILRRIKGSENLDRCNTVQEVLAKIEHSNGVNFMCIDANGKEKRYFLDFLTNSVVIKYSGYIHTLFTFYQPAQGYHQVLNNFKTKFSKVKIISKYVETALKQL